jgi:Tfp pilus assembly protein PilF
MSDRKQQLLEMLAKTPGDAFLHFALAMEHAKLGEHEQALQQFARVIEIDPTYTPAYTQQAVLLEKLGRLADAKAVYRRGIESARARGDRHAESKMQETLDRLVRATGE